MLGTIRHLFFMVLWIYKVLYRWGKEQKGRTTNRNKTRKNNHPANIRLYFLKKGATQDNYSRSSKMCT